jgi:multicomponent Na+:H+ antiporter subunit C
MISTMPLVLVAVMVVLYAGGVYLLLDRSLTRLLLGFLLVGNATNLMLFLMSDGFGVAPIAGSAEASEMSDPLPQAFILTAIVITFGVSAFLLALIYRSWRLAKENEDTVRDEAGDLVTTMGEGLDSIEVTDEDLAETNEFEDEKPSESSSETDAHGDPVTEKERPQ